MVIIGGQIQGCETAEFLVKRGRKITIVEPSDRLGSGMPGAGRTRLLVWLAEKNVVMLTEVTVAEITDKGVRIATKNGERQVIEADTILPVLPLKANKELFEALQGKVPEVYAIGDCNEPQLILEAIADGARIGHAI